jgi:hypothetical protein
MRILQGPKQSIGRLLFSPNCSGLAAEIKGKAVYWPTFDAPNPRVFRPLAYRGIDLAADGIHVLAHTTRGLRIYGPDDPEGKRLPTRSQVSSFACSPTEPLVVVQMTRVGRAGWRIGTKGEWELLWEGNGGSPYPPQFAADGALVFQEVSTGFDPTSHTLRGVIEAHDPQTGKLVEAVPSSRLLWYGAVLSPDTRLIATVFAKDISVFVRDSEWRKARTLHSDTRMHFTDAAFHPSGKYLAATNNDATVKLYDTTTWEVARTFSWDIGRVRSIAFSRDGTLAAAGSDKGKVVVWDVDL